MAFSLSSHAMSGVIAHIPDIGAKFVPIPPELLSCRLSEVHEVVTAAVQVACDLALDAHEGTLESVRLLYKDRALDDERSATAFLKSLSSGFPCSVRVLFRLLGGKGGFGALLRGQKGRGKKTQNFDSMRDLSGRRLRHAKAVERIKVWMENKKKQDELVDALKGEGPELPKAIPESESLSPDFIRQLKRAAKERPALVSEGIGQSAKRPRSAPKSYDWNGAFDALAALSSGSDSGSESVESISDPICETDGTAATSTVKEGVASSSSGVACQDLVGPLAPCSSAEPLRKSSQRERPSSDSLGELRRRTEEESRDVKLQHGIDTEPIEACNQVVLTADDVAKFGSAEDLEKRVSPDVLKRSLERLGLKCGGRPKDRADRLFLLKTMPLDKLPPSAFAKKQSA